MSTSEIQVLLLSGRFEVRGSCASSLRLMEGLPSHGITPRLICPNARLVDLCRRKALRIDEYPHFDSLLWSRVALSSLARELAAAPPDLIHLQSRRVLRQGSWLARKLKRPFVLTMHDYLRQGEKLRVDWRWCQRIIAVSESVRSDLCQRAHLAPELVTVIRSGVETASDPTLSVPLDPGHVPVVGTAGPLEAVKGLPYFLGAAERVLAGGRDVEFLIAGAGPEEANLRRLARELGISQKVTFVPYLLNFRESLAAMDIFCLPSLQQGLGTVMLEAMALGRPVIATGVGGVYSIVKDGETGLIVPPSNSGELARRIDEILNDPVRARAIAATARERVVQEFSASQMVDQTVAVYQDVLSRMPKPAAPAVSAAP